MAETATKAPAKKSPAKKSPAKKSTSAKRTATAAKRTATNATKRATGSAKRATPKRATTTAKRVTQKRSGSSRRRTPRLLERAPSVVAQDAVYAIASLTNDTVATIGSLPARAQTAPARVVGLAVEAPERARAAYGAIASSVDQRLERLQRSFDARADAGRDLVKGVTRRRSVKRSADQAKTSRARVKGAWTSIVKTGEVAVEATREQTRAAADRVRAQAKIARTQVKGAATSVRKTADAAADAGRQLAS